MFGKVPHGSKTAARPESKTERGGAGRWGGGDAREDLLRRCASPIRKEKSRNFPLLVCNGLNWVLWPLLALIGDWEREYMVLILWQRRAWSMGL